MRRVARRAVRRPAWRAGTGGGEVDEARREGEEVDQGGRQRGQ